MINMKMSTIVKSAATIAAAGTVAFMVSNSSPRTKKRLKKTTGRALHSIGNIVSDISAMM